MDKKSIRALREEMGVSPRKFAKLFGVSHHTVRGWENGRKPSNVALAMLKVIGNQVRYAAMQERI